MHTYIYPVLTCCKKCIPIPAPVFAGILFKLCTPICTQTPPALCRQPSRFERLCPDFVASIGAHFFCLFFFVFFRRFVCCYMCTSYERRYLLRCTFFISSGLLYVYIFYIFFCIQTPPGFAGSPHALSGYLQQRFKLRCTLFISLFIFRRRLMGTICIHILSGYLQQHLRLRCTFFLFLFFLLCYTFQHTRHTAPQSQSEPRFCLSLPFFLLFWYFMRRNIFNGCMAVLERQAVFAYFFFFFYGFLLDFVAFLVDFVCTFWT